MFSMVVFCLVLATGIVAFRIREALVLGDRRALWIRSAYCLPLAVVTCAAFWLLIRDPRIASYLAPSGFDLGWKCEIYGKGSAQVCFKGDYGRIRVLRRQFTIKPVARMKLLRNAGRRAAQ